jgi:hypothetical protein
MMRTSSIPWTLSPTDNGMKASDPIGQTLSLHSTVLDLHRVKSVTLQSATNPLGVRC